MTGNEGGNRELAVEIVGIYSKPLGWLAGVSVLYCKVPETGVDLLGMARGPQASRRASR